MKNRTPLLITVALIATALVASRYIAASSVLNLENAQIVNAWIAIAACLGAFISATFVIFSYLQTNSAFVEAQRPHLLIQIESLHASEGGTDGSLVPVSRIHYRNITNNRFTDLSIHIEITGANRSFSMDDLFRPRMTMIGLDSRQRTFHPILELQRRGMDLQATASSGNNVLLAISYTYTFNGVEDRVHAQSYKWNAQRREWEIF